MKTTFYAENRRILLEISAGSYYDRSNRMCKDTRRTYRTMRRHTKGESNND